MAEPTFRSAEEVREVIDEALALMDADPAVGPRLRRAELPERLELTDFGLVVDVRPARDEEPGNLHWEWGGDVDWSPRVCMAMNAAVANRYFQGRESIAMALARRRIRMSGDVRAALSILPIVKPVFAQYRAMVEARFPHLVV